MSAVAVMPLDARPRHNFFRVLPNDARTIVPTTVEAILAAPAFQRGYRECAAGLRFARDFDRMPQDAQLDYERGRLFAAAVMARGVVPGGLLHGGHPIEGAIAFAETFAADWDPLGARLAAWRPAARGARASDDGGSAAARGARASDDGGSAAAREARGSNNGGSAAAREARGSNNGGSAAAREARGSNNGGSAAAASRS